MPVDVLEGVAEDVVVGAVEIRLLPVVLPLLDPVAGAGDVEVHAAHVEAAHLRAWPAAARRAARPASCPAPPPVVMFTTASVLCLISGRKRMNTAGSGVGSPVSRVARVQVDDRRAGLGRGDRPCGDLLRRDRQVGRHAGRVDRAGDGAADDDLVRHDGSPLTREAGSLYRNRPPGQGGDGGRDGGGASRATASAGGGRRADSAAQETALASGPMPGLIGSATPAGVNAGDLSP